MDIYFEAESLLLLSVAIAPLSSDELIIPINNQD